MKTFKFTLFKKICYLIIFFLHPFLEFNYSFAHINGIFSTKEEAIKQSKALGCIGIHKKSTMASMF